MTKEMKKKVKIEISLHLYADGSPASHLGENTVTTFTLKNKFGVREG